MNINIVGCSKVASVLSQVLSMEDHNIAVIDLDRDVLGDVVNAYDVIGVEGNGISISAQKEAGIDSADILIAACGSDEVNLLCCLIAKKSNKNVKTIARVRNPIYLDELSFFKEELGLAMIINPERAAAREIARILRFPSAMKIDTLSGGRIDLLKFRIEEDSPLKDMMIKDLSKDIRTEIVICAVERNDEVIIPNGSTVLCQGDRISFIASAQSATRFFREIKVETHAVKNTMIVGGGNITFYLAKELIDIGIDVKIIEKNKAKCAELDEYLKEATIINGDGTEETTIMEEGLETTQSLVALTNIDEENILLSLFTKKHNSKAKIVAKVNRMMFDSIIDEVDLGTILHTRSVVADNVAATVRAMENSRGRSHVETLVNILDGKAEALEFYIKEGSEACDRPLQELKLKDNVIVACIRRGNAIMYPKGASEIHVGDRVIIVTTHPGLNDINDILRTGGREA